MAITRVADISFTAGASTTTTVLKSSALFGAVVVGDRVYNSTRSLYSRVTVVTDPSTLTISPSITGQVAGDSVVISPVIQITGNYNAGTSTAIGATSITNSGAPWTASALIGRSFRLKDGTYANAFAYCTANTTTVATVEQWNFWNTTTKQFEIVTPTGTPTYEVSQNWNDVVTALGSDVAWLSTINKRHIRITGGSGINLADATAFFGDTDVVAEFPPQGVITSAVTGNCALFGKLNSDLRGTSGGEIIFSHLQSYFVDMTFYGMLYLLGALRKVNKLSSISNYPRWNAAVTSGTDGIIVVDPILKYGQLLHQTNDITLRPFCENENVSVRGEAQILDGVTMNNGNMSIAGKYGVSGIQGGKISYPKFYGSPVAGAGTRPFWLDTPLLPFSVSHIFSPYAPAYIEDNVDDLYDIYNANTYSTMTAGAGTNTTDIYGTELTSAGIGDYIYNVTRGNLACILAKPTNTRATVHAITGQTVGDTITLATRFTFNSYIHKVVNVASFKSSDNTALADVAVGFFETSGGAGKIVTDISTDTKLVTLTTGTNTTDLYCTGDAFSTVSVGDRIYNHTLQNYRIVLTKVDNNHITCDALTSQTVGDQVCFSSSLPYAPVTKRFVTMDGSGEYVSSFDTSKGVCLLHAFAKAGNVRYAITVTYTGALTAVALRYGYTFIPQPVSFESDGTEKSFNVSMAVNPYIVASEATARAMTGIAISGTEGAMVITVTEDHTLQEIYDYTEVWRYDQAVNNDVYYSALITPTAPGAYDYGTTTLTVNGCNVIDENAKLTTTVTVTNGGMYEDANGILKNIGGSTKQFTHYRGKIVKLSDASPLQNAVFAYGDETAGLLTYNTSWTLGRLVADVDGLVEGYLEYGVSYTSTYSISGYYGFAPAKVPRTLNGLPIGTTLAPEYSRLADNPEATKSRTDAGLITGVTFGSGTVDGGDNTLPDIYDRQEYLLWATTGYIYGTMLGCMEYCLNGRYVEKSGTNYTGRSTATEFTDLGSGGTFNTGTIIASTGYNPTYTIGTVTIDFQDAGTYDLRSKTITGTMILLTSDVSVTVLLPIGTLYDDTDPDVVVYEQRAMSISAGNIPAHSSILLENLTKDAEIDLQIDKATSGYTNSITVQAGGDNEIGDVLRLRAFKANGAEYSEYYEASTIIGSSGDWTITNAWEDWSDANALLTDGSAVNDFQTDFTDIEIDIVDVPLMTWWGRELVAFILYKTWSEEDGMRKFFGAMTAQNPARWVVDITKVNLLLDNLSADSADQTDEVIVSRSDGSSMRKIPTTGGGGIGIAIANDVSSLLPSASATAQAVIDAGALTTDDFLALK